jgi:hypothetical protein
MSPRGSSSEDISAPGVGDTAHSAVFTAGQGRRLLMRYRTVGQDDTAAGHARLPARSLEEQRATTRKSAERPVAPRDNRLFTASTREVSSHGSTLEQPRRESR